jgi:phosphonate dehydrogenase
MRLVYCDSVALDSAREQAWGLERVSLDALLQESDFVVPMLPMTPETFHLINDDSIARMNAALT